MTIKQAQMRDLETVGNITRTTINEIYPHYYPAGAVAYFLEHHSDGNISSDISAGRVYLLADDAANAAGTVTIKDNEICRLFVLPRFQGKGYGKSLIAFAENEITKRCDEIILDASLGAKSLYLKLGYRETGYNLIEAPGGDYLCYSVMKKQVR